MHRTARQGTPPVVEDNINIPLTFSQAFGVHHRTNDALPTCHTS